MARVYCCVEGCNSTSKKDPKLRFHRFPLEGKYKVPHKNKRGVVKLIDVRKAWTLALNISRDVKKSMVVCRKHFLPSDYFPPKYGSSIRNVLKKNSVPKRKIVLPPKKNPLQELAEAAALIAKGQEKETQTETTFKEKNTQTSAIQTKSVFTQATHVEDRTICANIQDEKKFVSLTGVPTSKIFDYLVKLYKKMHTPARVVNLTHIHRVALLFIKLKTNLVFDVISLLFENTCSTYCKRIFLETLQIVSDIIEPAIYLPTIPETKEETTSSEKSPYDNARLMLDCVEVKIQKSQNSSINSMKIMFGVVQSGFVVYVSKPYINDTCEKAIVEESGLLDKLRPNIDSILVERDFGIDELCKEKRINVLRPPFHKYRKFVKQKATDNLFVARNKIKQKIKLFQILNQQIHYTFYDYLEQMFIVIVGVNNMSNPIFDKKLLEIKEIQGER